VAGPKLHQVGRNRPDAKTLQDLNGIIGGTVKHHTAIGELGIFPFATFAAIAEQAIFERAVVEQLTVKPYRLLA
jgi:predicted flap endonuclease-1-like 5' DNA nuclease